MLGTVRWFSVKKKHGFINRSDTGEDILVHWTASLNNPQETGRSVVEGETVEFDVLVGKKE